MSYHIGLLFSVLCVLELLLRLVFGGVRFVGWSCASACKTNTKNSNTQRTENKTTDVVLHQHSRKLLKMDILMSETCWAHNKWNKIASDIKLVFHSSTIAMMHGPINIRFTTEYILARTQNWKNRKYMAVVALWLALKCCIYMYHCW
jgi:hypothetical protein